MTTGTERCPQCDDNNRCGHEWHGDTWEHQAATVIRGLRAELDAARAREQRMREELSEIGVALNDPADNLTATTAQCITRLRAREAKLRAALRNIVGHTAHLPAAPRDLLTGLLESCARIARAALAEGDTRG